MEFFFELLGVDAQNYAQSLLPIVAVVIVLVVLGLLFVGGFFSAEIKKQDPVRKTYRH